MKFLLGFKNNMRWLVLFFLFILSFILWTVAVQENRGGKMKVVFLDIGQGDSIFIESPTGTQVLIDGGPNRNLMKQIGKVMPWYDRSVDMILITHPDKDHYEGFLSFLDKYKVGVEMNPGIVSENEEYNFFLNKLNNKKVPEIIAHKGQIVDLGGGAYLQIISLIEMFQM